MGYNVQTAVDAEHHLIVTHTVTNQNNDRDFLTAGGVMSDDMIDAYIALKQVEVQTLNMSTHPVEFDMYYSC